MKLGDLIYKAKEDYINKNKCSICQNSIEITTATAKNSIHKTKTEVYLCSKGLKFPKCRILVNEFREK